jgi:hypothetical protein
MSSYKNRSCYNSQFFIKEFIDKEKLISKIFRNIESKTKIIEKYKNKFYNTNNISESIVLDKLEFLEILNDFEEIISQSLQGMKTLFAEIRNLRDKKEMDEKLIKRRNNKNISLNMDKSYTAYINKCANKKENIEQNEKNKSNLDSQESLFMNIYGYKNKNNTNNKNNFMKLYFKKNTHYKQKNNKNSINNKKNNENISKTTTRNTINENKNCSKINKNTSVDSIGNKDVITYDLSLINDLDKENQNPNKSSLLINNEYNTLNINTNNKNEQHRRILRLDLKKKNGDNKKIKSNNSMCQRYELELENTEKDQTEKIEVDVKFPIRQGIRNNCRRKSEQIESSKSELLDKFNYNSNKNEIIEKIKKNTKIKEYFSKKYGDNKFEIFLNKFWKNKLNPIEINKELNIIIQTFETEEKYNKI